MIFDFMNLKILLFLLLGRFLLEMFFISSWFYQDRVQRHVDVSLEFFQVLFFLIICFILDFLYFLNTNTPS